jgi:hypothetical protein
MLGSTQLAAQTAMPNIEERARVASDRIYQGIRAGDLTPTEAERLYFELGDVRRLMRNARKDGAVYQTERSRIRERLETLERDIDRLRANRRR